MVLPFSNRISRVPSYSFSREALSDTGLSPAMAGLPMPFSLSSPRFGAPSLSFATTQEMSVDVFSSGY